MWDSTIRLPTCATNIAIEPRAQLARTNPTLVFFGVQSNNFVRDPVSQRKPLDVETI